MQTVLEAIAKQTTERPEAVALCRAGHCLTYSELDARASGVAMALENAGVRPGSAVAVCLPRGFDQIVGALGAMRAGAAYVPCDPAWPRERVRTVVADAGATIVLTGRGEEFGAARVVDPADVDPAHLKAGGERVNLPVAGEDLAYVIYTSGSTGTPKGVEITHGNLAHLIAWHNEAFGVTAGDRASHLAGLGFDASVWEVWPYLAAGATVVLAPDAVRSAPELLRGWLVAERITHAFVPTALAEPMMALDWPQTTALRCFHAAGDTLHVGPRAGLPFTVWNCYGPTEGTVCATAGVVKPGVEGLPTIGRAIAGTFLYVLDETGEPVPAGEPGELWIGGGGVAHGYRGQPELTAERFVTDRFRAAPGARMYRTGDLGVLRAQGEIEFRGRADGQVKIRGQRMELDEVISVLNRHPAVAFNTVVVERDGADKRLTAYVLRVEGTSPTAQELREFVAAAVPGYMVPATFVGLSEIPLNGSGKLDRALLPQPSPDNLLPAEVRRLPASSVEETVLQIIQSVLKTTDVGVDDDFFLVGGHSLMGTQLVMRVRESFGVPVTLRDLFECATAAQLAQRVEEILLAEMEGLTDEEAMRLAVNAEAAD